MRKNVDILIVGLGMAIGFSVVLMHLTGLWPCSIINGFEKTFFTTGIHNNSNTMQINYSNNTSSTNSLIYYLKNFFRCS